MKTLLLLRHAKSSWEDAAIDDHERPLNARGRRDAPRMGDFVREMRLVPDVILTSDAVRAHDTATAVAEAAGYEHAIVTDPLLYHAGPDDIVAVLQSLGDEEARTVMIVAHNPGLEDFVEEFTGEAHRLPTAALVRLSLPIESWRDLTVATRATVAGVWRPKELS